MRLRSLLLSFIILLLCFVLPALAAFPIYGTANSKSTVSTISIPTPRPATDNRYDDGDERHSWPGAVAIAFALAGFALLANPVMLVPLAAGALAIIMGLIGTDKEHFKRRGMAIAGIIAGAIVIAALLL